MNPSSKLYGFPKRNSFDQPDLEDLLLKNLSVKYKVNVYYDNKFFDSYNW